MSKLKLLDIELIFTSDSNKEKEIVTKALLDRDSLSPGERIYFDSLVNKISYLIICMKERKVPVAEIYVHKDSVSAKSPPRFLGNRGLIMEERTDTPVMPKN